MQVKLTLILTGPTDLQKHVGRSKEAPFFTTPCLISPYYSSRFHDSGC